MGTDHYYSERYLLQIYEGKIFENDSEYQMILNALKKRCEENDIEYNSIDEYADTLLKQIVDNVNNENQIELAFSSFANFENDLINNINNLTNLPIDKQIITIDSIINYDYIHNPTKSIIILLREYLIEKMEELICDLEILLNGDEFRVDFDPFSQADGEKTISEDTKKDYKEKLELFMLFPKISKAFETRKKYIKQLYEIESKLRIEEERIKSPDYISELEKLVNHHDTDCTYYYHGAPSQEIANGIMNSGLYMQYSEMSRTAKKELSVSEILDYSYGHDNVGRHAIVVLSVPNGENVIEFNHNDDVKIAGTGQGKETINEFKPKYVIPNKYIVGYIDKDAKRFIKNPNYYLNNKVEDSVEQQAELMIQAMANGQIDTNGQPIVQNQEIISNNRTMGFAKVWVLGILTTIASIVIIVIGGLLNK